MKKIKTYKKMWFLVIVLVFLSTSITPLVTNLVSAQTTTTKYLNGKIAFDSDRDGNSEIYIMNADGTSRSRITNNPDTDAYPAWSPDGAKLAFVSNRNGNNEIYTMNADGTNQTRLTNDAAIDILPAWSPNGTKLAFSTTRDGNYEIYTMNTDGTNQTRLTNNSAFDFGPAWSPNSSKIAFRSSRDGNSEIYVMNADGTNQTRLTNDAATDYIVSWSPDGTKVAFTSNRNNPPSPYNQDLYIMNADGTNVTRVTNTMAEEDSVNYSPDGTKLLSTVYPDENYNSSELFIMNTDGTERIQLTNGGGYDGNYSPNAWLGLPYTQTTNDDSSITSTIASTNDYSATDYTVVSNETLVLDGALCDVTVNSGGTLAGTGHACTITVNTGGTIAPGHSPGCITSGNLSLSGKYTAQLAGTTPCTGYDQLQVTGTVTTGGTLILTLLNNFIPKTGDTFTLITNDSNDPVTGTFTNLPEGATMNISGYVFKVSYIGGDGNDVTLTTLSVPASPNTGTILSLNNPLLTLVVTSLSATVILVIARRYSKI